MKRLLFIAHRVPYPPDKGERVRAFHEILALARHYRVTVAALAHTQADVQAAEGLRPLCDRLVIARAGGKRGLVRGGCRFLAGRSVTEGYFASPHLTRLLLEESRREPFDVIVAYSSGTLPYALAVPAAARVMDLVDVDSQKWSSYAAKAGWPRRWLYGREARAVRALEEEAVARCDAVLLVSEAEKQALGAARDNVLAVGNGVDTDYFSPAAADARRPPALVFTGTMDYRPNIEGVCWFVQEVWPALRKQAPSLTFTIVGRDPTRAVRQLAETPGVTVTGSVPDVRPYLAAATVAVTPLLIARGIQNKVLEAMAMGRAVIGSPAAIEGLEVTVGEHVLQAETPDEWVRTVMSLLTDAARRTELEQAARRCVEDRYSWDARMAPLVSLCERLTGASQTAGGGVTTSKAGRRIPQIRIASGIPLAEPLEGRAP